MEIIGSCFSRWVLFVRREFVVGTLDSCAWAFSRIGRIWPRMAASSSSVQARLPVFGVFPGERAALQPARHVIIGVDVGQLDS